MTTQEELPQVDQEVLTPLVRTATGRPDIQLDQWQATTLSVQGRRSIVRYSGTAQNGATRRPWSLILKVIRAPESSDAPDRDSQHWAYWQREYLVYESGIPQTFDGALRAPRCFGVAQPAPHYRWIWLEDLDDQYARRWPLERYGLAARHLGVFNGAYLTEKGMPASPWLARDALRWRSQEAVDSFGRLQDAALWERPLLRQAFPRPVMEDFARLLADREQFLGVLARLPQGFCHLDAWHGNMAALSNASGEAITVLFDWALCGYGAPGQEIGNLVWSSMLEFKLDVREAARLEATVFDGYLAGLAEAGWHGDSRLVRCAYLISSVLLFGLTPEAVDHAVNEEGYEALEAHYGWPLERMVDQAAAVTYHLFERAEELRALLDDLSVLQ